MFVGHEPVPLDPAHAPFVNTDVVKHSLAGRLVAMNAGDVSVFGDLIDPATGALQPMTGINAEAMTNAVDLYLDQFGVNMNTAVDGYREYYETPHVKSELTGMRWSRRDPACVGDADGLHRPVSSRREFAQAIELPELARGTGRLQVFAGPPKRASTCSPVPRCRCAHSWNHFGRRVHRRLRTRPRRASQATRGPRRHSAAPIEQDGGRDIPYQVAYARPWPPTLYPKCPCTGPSICMCCSSIS